jgi:NADPH:quinone reductase-like Zn-dependent oxidoreductase/acyl carrier protein
VVGDSKGFAERVSGFLEGAGGEALRVANGPGLSRAEWKTRLSSAGEGVQGVLVLSGLDAKPMAELSDDEMGRAGWQGWTTALRVAQALSEQNRRNPARLVLVTCRSQPVGPSSEVSPEQATLWGLGASIAVEHAEWRSLRIDISDAGSDAEASTVVAQMLSGGPEDQVAIRGKERHVPRLVPYAPRRGEVLQYEPAQGRAYALQSEQRGSMEGLVVRSIERRVPQAGEVEIQVESCGLNFLDVLTSLGVLGEESGPYPVRLGGECAGTIVSKGPGVGGLEIGQRVLSLCTGSMSSHVTLGTDLVFGQPPGLTASESATLPVVHATVYYALTRVARLSRGERILIHSAAGGVGQAALQWSQHVGAEIYATAGSEAKRAYLRAQGVKYVADSRTPQFADDILKWTGGEGVDVVLNALSGAFIEKGLSVLRDHGRFVELGKRDYVADKPLHMRPFLRNLSFALVDLRSMIRDRPKVVREVFEEVLGHVAGGVLRPIPHQVFSMADAAEVFREMARGHHSGKWVLNLDPQTDRIATKTSGTVIRPNGTYVVSGGLGGLGLSLARWMSQQGAEHVVLVGRSGVRETWQQEAIARMQASGTQVTVAPGDVGNSAWVQQLLSSVATATHPLRGVVHAAAVLDDGMLEQQTPERFEHVMRPKVGGAWNLHRWTQDEKLDFFVLYSSGASLLGSPGQSNYVAANAFVDALAWYRRQRGLPALSINWGAFSDVGLAAAQANRGARLAERGLSGMTSEQGEEIFGRLASQMQHGPAQVGAMPFNARQWVEFYPQMAGWPYLQELLQRSDTAAARRGDGELLRRLSEGTAAECQEVIAGLVREELNAVLRVPASRITDDTPFKDLGMDSLMGLEVRNRLESSLGVTLPATLLWTYSNLRALAAYLLGRIHPSAPDAAVPSAGPDAKVLHSEALGKMNTLSDQQLFEMAARSLTTEDEVF